MKRIIFLGLSEGDFNRCIAPVSFAIANVVRLADLATFQPERCNLEAM